jgi:hypothetical protein
MIKNEILASWVYKKGELAKQRLAKKTAIVAFVTGVIIFVSIVFPLKLWDVVFFKKATVWLLLAILLLVVGAVYYLLHFFSGIVFGVFKKVVAIKEEEVIVTSAKIITENKTWMLHSEQRSLTEVVYNSSKNPSEIIFRGQEARPGNASSRFVVKLPLPKEEHDNGEKIYNYFKQLVKAGTKAPDGP